MKHRQFFDLATSLVVGASILSGCQAQAPLPPSFPVAAQTCPGLGRAQGATVHDQLIYLYGDADPGILREYQLVSGIENKLQPTGRSIRLTQHGENLLNHPTGLAWRDGMPCFLGNTITATKEGRIYCLDLSRGFDDGTLDHAVLNATLDDLAVQGARPEYVRFSGRWLVATSDYGGGPNYVRIYDPTALSRASRTSDPGVLIGRVPCGPWVQSLHWIDSIQTLVIVQNITEGRGWRLTLVSNLNAADYRSGAAVRVIDIPAHNDELEGYVQIKPNLGLLITSSSRNNVTFAVAGRQPAFSSAHREDALDKVVTVNLEH
jgi:hypothetical protein